MNNPLFRPPAEADSLILQVDQGCPSNRCTFCGMYRSIPYRRLDMNEIKAMATKESRHAPETHRIFLADADVMGRSFDEWREMLSLLNAAFPHLSRVNTYACGRSIMAKSELKLHALRNLKLHTLYMGLESGDEKVLQAVRKVDSAECMIKAGQMAQAAGLRISVMILLGLGGKERSHEHARLTADALNRMQPKLLSALRVVPVPGTELHLQANQGQFHPLTEHEAVQELREMIAQLDLQGTVFRANHNSNVVPLEGRFPRDKARLLQDLDRLLGSRVLNRQSPGPLPLWL